MIYGKRKVKQKMKEIEDAGNSASKRPRYVQYLGNSTRNVRKRNKLATN